MVATRFLVLLKKTTLTSVSILQLSLCALSFWLILNKKKKKVLKILVMFQNDL